MEKSTARSSETRNCHRGNREDETRGLEGRGRLMSTTTAVMGSEIVGAELSEQELQILDFERGWWRFGGAKEDAIREQFDFSATRYYQTLNRLIDTDAALSADPVLVRRLRRLRQARQEARSASHRS
jgi:hypothetical protein